MRPPRELRVPKASELIVAQLRDQIIKGAIKPGDVLPAEADLCREFRVSRPTIREAIRILESETLIQIGRGARGGARIIAPSEQTAARYVGRYLQYANVPIVDVHQALIAIELPAMVRLANNRSKQDLIVLERLLDEEREQYGDNGSEAILAGSAFHRAIVELAGNRTLAIMHGMIEEVTIEASREIANTLQSQFAEEARRFYRVHEETTELIRTRNVQAAEKLWRRHLEAKIRILGRIASRASEVLAG